MLSLTRRGSEQRRGKLMAVLLLSMHSLQMMGFHPVFKQMYNQPCWAVFEDFTSVTGCAAFDATAFDDQTDWAAFESCVACCP